jgi:hypothetical protein
MDGADSFLAQNRVRLADVSASGDQMVRSDLTPRWHQRPKHEFADSLRSVLCFIWSVSNIACITQTLFFFLPGRGQARVCTKRETYPDGRIFVGVGVQPQYVVHPKLDDLRHGKDTVLSATLDLIQQGKASAPTP